MEFPSQRPDGMSDEYWRLEFQLESEQPSRPVINLSGGVDLGPLFQQLSEEPLFKAFFAACGGSATHTPTEDAIGKSGTDLRRQLQQLSTDPLFKEYIDEMGGAESLAFRWEVFGPMAGGLQIDDLCFAAQIIATSATWRQLATQGGVGFVIGKLISLGILAGNRHNRL